MTEQQKWIGDVLNLFRITFESGIRNMDTFQEQAEKALELTMSNSDVAQDEVRKSFDAWIDNVKKSRQVYTSAVEEGLANLEQQFSKKGKQKSKK